MKTIIKAGLISLSLGLSLAAAAPALAHHSFAMFDFQKEQVLTGTVEKYDWTNPHTFIWLQAPTGANGAMERWGLEGMSPNYLGRRGWSKTTLNPGDKITVTIHPLKDGAKGGTYLKVTLSNGKDMLNFG
jgi:hypothetical protein